MLKIISKLRITVFIFILIGIILSMISYNISFDNKFSNLLASSSIGSGIGGGNIIGKVSNTFGTPLNRDVDKDGDSDACVVVNNIAGGKSDDVGKSLYVDSSGNFYITGYSKNADDNGDMYVIKLNNDGNFDTSFGNKGKDVVNNIAGGNGWDRGNSLYVDGARKVYVTGYSKNAKGNFDMYVIRLKSDGSIDNTFGNNGQVVVDNIAGGKGYDYGYSLYVDSKGKVYVTGASWNGSNSDMYVIRLNSDGSLDNAFGTNGKVVVNNIAGGNSHDVGYSLYVDKNGKVYVTGFSHNATNSDMYVLQIE